MTVNQRITKIYETLQITQYRFAKDTGVSTATLNNLIVNPEGSPSFSTIQKILSSYKNLNARWLLMGEGEMWINENLDIAKTDISKVGEPPTQYEPKKKESEKKEEPLPSDFEILKKTVELMQIEMWKLKAEMEELKKANK